jgi:hypothetical protein
MAAGDMGINRPGRDGPSLGNEARQGGIFIRAVKRVENRRNLIVRVVAEFVHLRRVIVGDAQMDMGSVTFL